MQESSFEIFTESTPSRERFANMLIKSGFKRTSRKPNLNHRDLHIRISGGKVCNPQKNNAGPMLTSDWEVKITSSHRFVSTTSFMYIMCCVDFNKSVSLQHQSGDKRSQLPPWVWVAPEPKILYTNNFRLENVKITILGRFGHF